MKYKYHGGPLFGKRIVRLTDDAIELLNTKGVVKRRIRFDDVKEFREYSGITVRDKNGQQFAASVCRIVPGFGWSIMFQSSSFVSHGTGYTQIAKNQFSEFHRFRNAIGKRVVAVNPHIETEIGHRLAWVMGYGTIGLGVAMQGLFLFGALSTGRSVSAVLMGVLIGAFPAGLLVLLGRLVVKAYRPVRKPIAETLRDGKITRGSEASTSRVS